MRKIIHTILFSLFIAFLGLLSGALAYTFDLEEKFGLKFLFALRGSRTAPPDPLVVAMDQRSIRELGLAREMEKWPRRLHADLVQRLHTEGAAAISFDVIFDDAQHVVNDQMLADVVNKTGNVVLGAYLHHERLPLAAAEVVMETLYTPIPLLAKSAAGYGPFPLPKSPLRVSQAWLFKGADDLMPTMPVVAFQVWALRWYEMFTGLLKQADPSLLNRLPQTLDEVRQLENINLLIKKIRSLFNTHPVLSKGLTDALNRSSLSVEDTRAIRAMIDLYGGPSSRYLNFYGPAGSLPFVSYSEVLQSDGGGKLGNSMAPLKDKAVFVGRAERFQVQKEDVFYTVFSKANGVDVSGVEIAATTFANLLDNSWVRPLRFYWHLALIVTWGAFVGAMCSFARPLVGGLGVIGCSVVYVSVCRVAFDYAFCWMPMLIPVFVQGPAAFLCGLFQKYRKEKAKRKIIQQAFGYYLPKHVVKRIAGDIGSVHRENRLVYGVVLSSDAQQYTQMAEKMDPGALRELMNRYYQLVFGPVKDHGGYVSDVVGDAMLALWTSSAPDVSLRGAACAAALEIADRIEKFKEIRDTHQIPTRIGIHAGYFSIGNLGAGEHYEYRAVGDIVNTASRIEGLNKHLGTKILVSDAVTSGLEGFFTQPLGFFLLPGKSKPVNVATLLCRDKDVDQSQKDSCQLFDQALHEYTNQSLDTAQAIFQQVAMAGNTVHGPARFYVDQCERAKHHRNGKMGPTVIRMNQK